MSKLIEIDVNKFKSLSTSQGLGEASARFCYAAAGMPSEVLDGFLDLLESYSKNCHTPQSPDEAGYRRSDLS